jgi:lipopolysaccharide export system protein LptA
MVYASVLMLVSSASMVGQAADNEGHEAVNSSDKSQKKADVKPDTKAPIVIEADDLSFSDETGDVFAQGNVVVKQNTDVILTDAMRGNQKTTEVWIDGQATLQQPGSNLVGTHTHYNYTTKIGNMQQVKGLVGKDHISGKDMELFPDKMIAYNGTTTECPAKVPDYHMSADKIEIWPGDKMIAYNAKFWIKNMIIYSVPKYQTSLKKGAEQNAFPRIGYNNTDGLAIKQHFEYPIGDNVAAFADAGLHSKAGFKPVYGLINREKNYEITLEEGNYQDSNNNWIKKEPEAKFNFYRHRLGDLPISYTFDVSYGKWVGDNKTSWHQEENLYFTHDAINLGKNLSLGLGTGIQRIHESIDDSTTNNFKFDAVLAKQWSPKWAATTEYHYNTNIASAFDYNAADMSREFDLGFTYKIDHMNKIGIRQRYDLENDRVYDQDYTWYRDLHCWQAEITYRAKRHQLKLDLSTTRW